ncbi:hypothetical protein [Sphingobium chungbukense]|uniref:hypothetical protein n=1 Tax=Sphingobium chungbukense TaxID=56193 RepID=UPI0018DBC311|nr:hypothetical protein [Sphingobium chungbukense]
MVSPSSLLGAAGEHFIMSALLRHGFIAALAPVGVPMCDIVVTDDIGERLCAIQVKTRRAIGSDGGWHMSDKHEKIVSPTLFYAFVDFGIDALETVMDLRIDKIQTVRHEHLPQAVPVRCVR